ncbi:hypothetical protein D3C81_632960 [compost metagenome]|jgi:hypothetical protein|uniref:hypothetical protein n=1 Tax=Sphingobacterium TaxID=28453 RepID=UPI000FBD6285|nr:hypothetical protein [Sphingobacterium sp. GVS05A]
MENQINNNCTTIDAGKAKGIILLVAVVFGALIGFAANETFLSIIGGAVIGLIIAAFFNSVIYPQKPSDR